MALNPRKNENENGIIRLGERRDSEIRMNHETWKNPRSMRIRMIHDHESEMEKTRQDGTLKDRELFFMPFLASSGMKRGRLGEYKIVQKSHEKIATGCMLPYVGPRALDLSVFALRLLHVFTFFFSFFFFSLLGIGGLFLDWMTCLYNE